MAKIDDYISYASVYSKENVSRGQEYKRQLEKGQEIIAKIEEIQKRYEPNTSIDNYSPEDRQTFEQLQKELNDIEEQQNHTSFIIPDGYKEDSVSVYKYQQAEELGENIISEMEELRFKYYPNVSLENFSEEDRNRYSQLQSQLDEVKQTQKGLEWNVPHMHRQGNLESMERGMLHKTSGQIDAITRSEVFYDDLMSDKFKDDMELAKIAVNKELEALSSGDYERAKDCRSVYSVAFSNFSAHYWGESSANSLTEYIESKLGEKHKEIFQQRVEQYQNLTPEMSNEEIIAQLSDFAKVSSICHTSAGKEEKDKAKDVLEKVYKEKIAQLDKEITELKEHIEIPENEEKIEELQSQIEELETAWGTSVEYALAQDRSPHKKARIEEQGLDMSDIMKDIEETAKRKGRIYSRRC